MDNSIINDALKIQELESQVRALRFQLDSLAHKVNVNEIERQGLEKRHMILFNHVLKPDQSQLK